MNVKNYFLILGLIGLVIFSSCSKDDSNSPNSNSTKSAPKIEINGKTTGTILEVPAAANNANNGQFQGIVSNVNIVGQFVTLLNSVPENATIEVGRSLAGTTYYWTTAGGEGVSYEVWYTVEEDGANYNVAYEMASVNLNYPDMSFSRTTILNGWVAQNGADGHLVINYGAFTGGNANLNYVYDWDTNSAGDFHVDAVFNTGNQSQLANIHYEATVYADGHGQIDYSYAEGSNNIVIHYNWNANWTIVNWTYSVNGQVNSDMSGEWTA